MIGRFWDVLFDYADEMKAKGDQKAYEVCHDIEDLLQKAYDEGLSCSNVIKNHKPKTKIEALVQSIPDIIVYKDKNDGQIWYELESEDRYTRTRCDTPEEVLEKIISYRTNRLNNSMNEEKTLLLRYISRRLEELRNVREVLERDRAKEVVLIERRKK